MTDYDPESPSLDSFEWDDWENGGELAEDAPPEDAAPEPEHGSEMKPAYAGGSVHDEGTANRTRTETAAPDQGMDTDLAQSVYARRADPVFVFLFLLAVSVGLSPLAGRNPIERYALLWTLLALIGLAGPVLNHQLLSFRVSVNDLLFGVMWGVLLGLPLLLVGPMVLVQTSEQVFPSLPLGAVFLLILFVMAPVETVFFRGLIQSSQSWMMTAGMASIWSVLLFFPSLNVVGYPMVALIIGTFLVMLNAVYSYVRQRIGLTAAWTTQAVVSLMWLVIPRLLG